MNNRKDINLVIKPTQDGWYGIGYDPTTNEEIVTFKVRQTAGAVMLHAINNKDYSIKSIRQENG